ncbi:MAG: hypothetical protein J5379_07485 [Clostridiales bacterium]|nr:hypothetical protein [Clostridiales bacterium]
MTDKRSSRLVRTGLIIDFLTSLSIAVTIVSVEMGFLLYLPVIDLTYWHLLSATFLSLFFVLIRRLRIPQFLMILLHFIVGAAFVTLLYFISLRKRQIPIAVTVFMSLCVLALFIHSMLHRYTHKEKHVTFDGLAVTLSLHGVLIGGFALMHATALITYILLDAIIIVILYFVGRQLDVFETRYYHNLHSATQPVHSIKNQNRLSIFIVFGGVVFALLILLCLPIETITKILSNVILGFFGLIGKLIRLIPSIDIGGSGGDSEEAESIFDGIPDSDASGDPSPLSVIVTTIFVLIIAVMFFVFIISTIRRIIKRFRHAEEGERIVENDAVIDIIEEVPQKKKVSILRYFGEGEEGRIRKKYFTTVSHAIRSGAPVKVSSTTRQIEAMLKEKGDPSISELTSQYESVRYNKKED